MNTSFSSRIDFAVGFSPQKSVRSRTATVFITIAHSKVVIESGADMLRMILLQRATNARIFEVRYLKFDSGMVNWVD